jgi:cysteine-rich repeat protein
VTRLRIVLSTVAMALSAGGTLAAHGACGGGAVCGDGKAEGGEPCDDGNDRDDDACSNACVQQPTHDAQIIWTMLGDELDGFYENCSGVAASDVHLTIAGPLPFDMNISCSLSPYMITALMPGEYTVTGTLLDSAGHPLTNGQTTTTFSISGAASGTPVQVRLDFPYTDFVRTDYTGDWFYLPTWGGKTCSMATPPVTKTTVRIERGGTPVKSKEGVAIDGTMELDCFEGPASKAPAVNHLPWGPADVVITGLDATGTPAFSATFSTWVGAGIQNPTFAYDVQSLAPDAGVPDAGVPASDAAN